MNRFRQLVFALVLLAFCWYFMMLIHECGHILGAMSSGSTIQKVVLDPMEISRTEVSPNRNPLLVVWAGPVVGAYLPLFVSYLVPGKLRLSKNIVIFVAGFCLIANGAYIGVGVFSGVGDCGEMLQNGSPVSLLMGFGAVTASLGLWLWHRLGSLSQYWNEENLIHWETLAICASALIVVLISGTAISSAF